MADSPYAGVRWCWWAALLGSLVVGVPPAEAQWRWQDWFRRPRVEPATVRYWAEKVRYDPDAAQRLEAVRRLAEVDPRVHGDVLPALLAALRYDPAPAVRQAAAETLGRFPVLYAQAGLALEQTLEQDQSLAVREAARQGLWNYHLLGYRSSKGVGGFIGQTEEPPLALPATTVLRSGASQTATSQEVRITPARWGLSLPSLFGSSTRLPSPIRACPESSSAIATVNGGNGLETAEPPIARPSSRVAASVVHWHEPPVRPLLREPPRMWLPPPIAASLPPIVPLPEEILAGPPRLESTAEPPLAQPSHRR
ncbi:MAG: HEAT repeat domain-containing protein [Gemmataceae bacterium]|nr:HEAT repeat domain-containing protein [Gemmataceae bacterium]MCS7271845.1 HEAT repeat domain-containing protein [Gemmataceae bacterium]MDW8242358.1 HEAT repeat domain-containing protein [Thermogemmata sp.]